MEGVIAEVGVALVTGAEGVAVEILYGCVCAVHEGAKTSGTEVLVVGTATGGKGAAGGTMVEAVETAIG